MSFIVAGIRIQNCSLRNKKYIGLSNAVTFNAMEVEEFVILQEFVILWYGSFLCVKFVLADS
jgi:hypothetical protein